MTTMDLHPTIRIYHWKKCRHQYMTLQLNKCYYYVNVRTVNLFPRGTIIFQ